ncbi:MAG TPA: dual specificity protein phosphatase [Ktedonobacterales bacterium]
MHDPASDTHDTHIHADEAAARVVAPAESQAELSGRGMLRRGAARWALTGVIRLVYRTWTRVAVRLFPEDSRRARMADRVGLPLPDRLNMSWITPQLAVGGRIHPEDIARLAKLGVTRVVDTRSEHCDDRAALAAHGIELLYLPTPDTFPLTLEQLAEGTEWIVAQIAAGERVLVHCEHGVGRSVLLTAAALVTGGMSAEDAIRLVQSGRWQAAPNHLQMLRLQEFERMARAPATPR